MAQRETHLTPEGQLNLQKELEHLKTARRLEVASRIHRANQAGGTVDNAEYDDAKNEQAFVEGRISELENILSTAVVTSGKDRSKGAVEFGSSVTVVADDGKKSKKKKTYKLVGSAEAAPLENKISVESPVGRALLGRKVGDKVSVEIPSGAVKLTISKVS